MSGGPFGIALSGLQSFQRAINTTSHNIVNASTEGYSRQRVDLTERNPNFTGTGFVGNGVDVVTVRRYYDGFLSQQMRSSSTAFTEIDQYYSMAAQIDNILADSTTSMAPALRRFFNAVHSVANDPTSIPARQSMLAEGQSLTDRFKALNGRFDELRTQINTGLDGAVSEVNTLAESIADINRTIVVELGRSGGRQVPNDLLDQRNLLLVKLSEKVNVNAIEQSDGSLTVLIGSGQSLVQGTRLNKLNMQVSSIDPTRKDIVSNDKTVITSNLSGGEIGGLLKFQDEVLGPAQKQLGRLAAGLALEFNAQHRIGYDLNGNIGLDFFNPPPISVLKSAGNDGAISVGYDTATAPAALQASDYQLDYNGVYTLTRLSDKTQWTDPTGNFTQDGITVSVNVAPRSGSHFIIKPVQEGAQRFSVAIADPRAVAAAGDIKRDALGNPELDLRGKPIPLVGDNRNALKLAGLDTKKFMLSGSADLQDVYAQIVTNVGTLTHNAEMNRTAQQGLLEQAKASYERVSGVNLDEEAANLLAYQQAYQASAQVVSTVNTLFDTLLGVLRS
jgi:flagellar hook-associated protein 1 FlgK